MWPLPGLSGKGKALMGALPFLLIAFSAMAQEAGLLPDPPAEQEAEAPGALLPGGDALAPGRANAILTLDQDRLFEQSAWGNAAIAAAERAFAALSAENQQMERQLEAEERDLTAKRATMTPGEFAPLARAFDTRVEEIRTAQDSKSRSISRRLDEDRKRFFDLAVPLLIELLKDHEATVIIAQDSVILSLNSADVTSQAIALMDLRLPAPAAGDEPDATGAEGQAGGAEIPAGAADPGTPEGAGAEAP